MDLKEAGINIKNLIASSQDRDYWRAPLTLALNFQVPEAMELDNWIIFVEDPTMCYFILKSSEDINSANLTNLLLPVNIIKNLLLMCQLLRPLKISNTLYAWDRFSSTPPELTISILLSTPFTNPQYLNRVTVLSYSTIENHRNVLKGYVLWTPLYTYDQLTSESRSICRVIPREGWLLLFLLSWLTLNTCPTPCYVQFPLLRKSPSIQNLT